MSNLHHLGSPLPSTTESAIHKTFPGNIRRFWWRTGQPARLAILSAGALVLLATTGAIGFMDSAPLRERGNAGLDAAVRRGDSIEVTVRSVSDVDSFEGVESGTGLRFPAQVVGLRPSTGCRLAESRAVAENLLRGKNVRLIVRKDSLPGSDRIAVDVELPDRTDYARILVQEGVASADLPARSELAQVETVAREEHRGLWRSVCDSGEPKPTSSAPSSSSPSPLSSSAPVPTTTTTAATTTETPVRQPAPSSTVTTTSAPPQNDDEWVRDRVGRQCPVEGARRKSPKGTEIVCARNDNNKLRWRRAD